MKRSNDITSEMSRFRRTDDAVWQFWRDGLSSSMIGCFLDDKEHCRQIYVNGWTRYQTPLGIAFGSCCHWVLQKAYSPSCGLLAERVAPSQEWILEQVEQYHDWLPSKVPMTPASEEQHEFVCGLAEQVLPPYFERWDGDFGEDYTHGASVTQPVEWLQLEQQFRTTLEFDDGYEVPIRGARDAVFKDARGRHWLMDTKCLSVINEENILKTMDWDFQHMLYLWAFRKETGITPAGLIKNVIRRPQNRQRKSEDLTEFLERIGAGVADPKNYDHYFSRYELAIAPAELDEWEEIQLKPIVNDIRDWWEGKTWHYLNPKSLDGKYGLTPYLGLVTRGDTTNCYQREQPHPELEEV